MTTHLIQKPFLRGVHTFEILADRVDIRSERLWSKTSLSVMLTVLNPEPLRMGSRITFVSRVNGEGLVTLFRNRPDAATCEAFVATLRQCALSAYNAFTGMSGEAAASDGLGGHGFGAAPSFDEADHAAARVRRAVDPAKVENAIAMLRTYVGAEVDALIAALEVLQLHPEDTDALDRVATEFAALGFRQGAVLTYAPYLSVMLSDDPFSN